MNYPKNLFVSGPIGRVTNHVVEIFDPLTNSPTKRLLLNSERRRSLLFFYRGDFSIICPTELQKLNLLAEQFDEEKTEILVISRDSMQAHEKWLAIEPKLEKFKIKMVSDIDGQIGKELGIINPDSKEYERCSLIVSPEGQVAHICVVAQRVGRNIDELLRRVKALNYLLMNPEVMCPEDRNAGGAGITSKDEPEHIFSEGVEK